MRKSIVVFAIVLLTTCNKSKVIISNDSSPILISDGSVHLNQKYYFRVHSGTSASIRLLHFKPGLLGYQCSPEAGECTAGTCNPTAQPMCQLNLSTLTDWTLDIADDHPMTVASVAWNSGVTEKITLTLPTGFSIMNGSVDGVDLVPTGGHLKSAVLTVHPTGTYNFDFSSCPYKQTCLWVGYVCTSGCSHE
ncbi:MAG: hypothetical protein C5B51_08430 [Terriglobia bacterium]|nr:MAG: hypothetical protein C5B51_08430 [Terriglobia bacterium]